MFRRIVLLVSMAVIVLAMVVPAALAQDAEPKPRFDCFKDRGHKRLVDVNKKKAEKAENRGFVCFKRTS